MICTFGAEGLLRIARGSYPAVEGVEYLVSWQCPADEDKTVEIPEALKREDFRIFTTDSKGLSRNRNHALSLASAPYCLLADDDLNYFADGLKDVINTFDNNPGLDIASFEYCGADSKAYPSEGFDLRHPPKGYFITSFEIAFRREKVMETGILFDTDFGVGAKYPAGEEDLWLDALLRQGLTARFYPILIAEHTGPTSGIRLAADPQMIRTKGAVFRRRFPLTWPGRMLTHALRQRHSPQGPSPLRYTLLWLQGALNRSFFKSAVSSIPIFLIIFIGAIYVWLSFNIVPVGDDLGFFWSYEEQRCGLLSLPRFIYRHWIWNNGRMADMLTPIGLNILPTWLNAICNGVITAGMFLMILRVSGLRHQLSFGMKILIIYLIAFTFRWDALWMEFITQYNYVYPVTLLLLCLYILLSRKPFPVISDNSLNIIRWISIPLCLIAAAMHEAAGFPVAAGLFCYILQKRHWPLLSLSQKAMSAALILGGIFPLTSPAAYGRLGHMLQPESPFMMLMSSGFYVLILAIAIIFCILLNKKSRAILSYSFSSPWIIFVIAAFVSIAFMFASQYGGRTGWFAQIYALIALVLLLKGYNMDFSHRASIALASVLPILFIAHYISVGIWQQRLANETLDVIALYQASEDEVIFFDYHNEPQVSIRPASFPKTHGVPDDDDTYYRYRMQRHYGNGRPLTILPTAAKQKLDTAVFTDSTQLGFMSPFVPSRSSSDPQFIIRTTPLIGEKGDTIVEMFPRRIVKINGKEYIRNDFTYRSRPLILYSLMDRDRGEK